MKKLITLVLVLLTAFNTAYAFEKNYTATKKSVTTNKGAMIDTGFQLKISGLQEAEVVTTEDSVELSLVITPAPSDVGKRADIYNAVLIGDQWWMLNLEGQYVPWNRYVKQLVPFTEEVLLEESTTVNFLSGKFASSGTVRYFFGYMTTEDPFLVYTGKAFSINVTDGVSSSYTYEQQLSYFEENIESDIIQAKCVLCHVDGGLARNSTLDFSRTNSLSSANNLETIKKYLATTEGGAERILAFASGGNGHLGGVQLAEGSDGYIAMSSLLNEYLATAEESPQIEFNQGSGNVDELNYFGGATLEPRLQTLRRAARIVANRFPTDKEKALVETEGESGLEKAVLGMMSGQGFRNFIVNGTHDRLFTTEGKEAVNNLIANFPILTNKQFDFTVVEGNPSSLFWEKYQHRLDRSLGRAGGELIAYIVENEKPYSEILTADYIMLNSLGNWLLGGDAEFSDEDNDMVFKPAQIIGYYNDVRETIQEFNDQVLSTKATKLGDPVDPYPHSGLLTDLAFLGRYPTTATNRNRARARWTFYHFLDIDIEKSAQRPTDPDALADKNNPTMNNPACTVCHSLLDPMAGAFQNWNDFQLYQPNGGAIDDFFKNPPDGTESLYTYGDHWYSDMRPAGLFDYQVSNNEYALQEIGKEMVKERSFYRAAIKFWWQPIFGAPALEKPAVETDASYTDRIKAYEEQQVFINELTDGLRSHQNLKTTLAKMILSSWFRVSNTDNSAFTGSYKAAKLGNMQLLNPTQLRDKTEQLTDQVWGRSRHSEYYNGLVDSGWDNLSSYNLLYGGHDSTNVLTRQEELSSLMADVMLNQATSMYCPVTMFDFARPSLERKLFQNINPEDTPEMFSMARAYITTTEENEQTTVEVSLPVHSELTSVSLATSGAPTCIDYDGENCRDFQNWRAYEISVKNGDSTWQSIQINTDNIQLAGDYCHVNDGQIDSYGSSCTYTLKTPFKTKKGNTLSVSIKASARQYETIDELVNFKVLATDAISPYESNSENVVKIKNKIRELYLKFLGYSTEPNQEKLDLLFSIFVETYLKGKEQALNNISSPPDGLDWMACDIFSDFYSLNLIGLDGNNYLSEEGWLDWSQLNDIRNELQADEYYTKRAWGYVIAFLMSDLDYIYE